VTPPDELSAAVARLVGAICGPPGDLPVGLAVYRRAYHLRLLGCLRADFPVLERVLGAELFALFITAYLEDHPPASPNLGDLGAQLPAWLARTAPPGVTLPVDVARLERARVEVLRAPGIERERADWLDAPDAAARAALAPTVRLLRLDHPLADLLTAVHAGREVPLPTPAPTRLVLARRAFEVTVHTVDAHDAEVLDALARGERLDTTLGELAVFFLLRAGPRGWLRERA
jgi:hypothetical protein